MAISAQLRERIGSMAEQLRREFYGGRGAPISGTKRFTELENDAALLGDAIACELMSQVLEQQAQEDHPKGGCACSVCRRQAVEDEVQPRIVQTRRGEVTWREPRYFCKHCRKAFFPSVERPGL